MGASRVAFWLGTALMVGCGSEQKKTMQAVLDDHRGSPAWATSSEAFKTIMRKYVHGKNHQMTDEELDTHYEQFLSLTNEDIEAFIAGQSCVPESGSGNARYYMINATHQRHDAFYKANQPHPIRGTGKQTAHATFSANMLLERHEIDASSKMPERAALPAVDGFSGAPFPKWKDLARALSDQKTFGQTFRWQDAAQGEEVFAVTSAYDWSKVKGELFIAPTLEGGGVFSPALFAVYMLKPTENAPYGAYVMVSADAQGHPDTPYVGVISDKRKSYKSYAGVTFTYLSSPENLLNYEVALLGTEPLSFDLWISMAYPDHPDQPYVTVRSPFVPAASEEMVSTFKDSSTAMTVMLIRKGALMRDLIELYYPDSEESELWNKVGAIHEDEEFQASVEASGLDVAVDLFDSDLWLEAPVVGAEHPTTYTLRPGMKLRCKDKATESSEK